MPNFKKPNIGKPRIASIFPSLSRRLPALQLPRSAPPPASTARPRPNVVIPGARDAAPLQSRVIAVEEPKPNAALVDIAIAVESAAAPAPGIEERCSRCGHDEALHPVRYVCDKYPFQDDPLRICGCESETLDAPCLTCGHRARWHKPRHRCRCMEPERCLCWGFEAITR
jgi:hypothetical protein